VQKPKKLTRPVPGQALADNEAALHIEGSKQRGRAMPLVVMRHGRGPSLLERDAWLCAVERLDLALLVDAEHDRALRRIEVKPDNVSDFLLELRVIRNLEALDEVRLQAGLCPDAPDSRRADTNHLPNRRTAPMRRVGRRLVRTASLTASLNSEMPEGRVLSRRSPLMPSSM